MGQGDGLVFFETDFRFEQHSVQGAVLFDDGRDQVIGSALVRRGIGHNRGGGADICNRGGMATMPAQLFNTTAQKTMGYALITHSITHSVYRIINRILRSQQMNRLRPDKPQTHTMAAIISRQGTVFLRSRPDTPSTPGWVSAGYRLISYV